MERISEGHVFYSNLLVTHSIEKCLKLRRFTYISMLHTKCSHVLRRTPFETIDISFFGFNVHGSLHRKNILIYIQQDATLHSLFYLETALHVSASTTTHHQERKQLYLQHLVFVTPLMLPAVIVEELELVWACCVTLHLVGYILEYRSSAYSIGQPQCTRQFQILSKSFQ